jgi:H+/Cl- antiporter ClcA
VAGSTAGVTDPLALRKSKGYVVLLVFAALLGVPVAATAYAFDHLILVLQGWLFSDLPATLGLDPAPVWWPVPILVLSGLLTAFAIERLPGTGGHSPADGFHTAGALPPRELAGVVAAALATLGFGVVLGPEAPLIAIGSGLGVLAVRLAKKDAPPQVATVMAAAGSFAAISTLLGSPLIGAFLLMEAAGLAGPMLGLVLLPGLLAAGVGTLIFLGLNSLTGLGTFSLAIPDLPEFTDLTVGMFGWAIVFGLVAAVLGWTIRRGALVMRRWTERRRVVLMPAVGAAIGVVAVAFDLATGRGVEEVLFSGEEALAPFIADAASWTLGALVLLVMAKALAYALSMSSFRGGPVFPAMFIGAALGIAASELPGMSLVPGVAMGLGAMAVAMLDLPLTSVLLSSLFVGVGSIEVLPLVIVAVVVAYVATARLPELGERVERSDDAATSSSATEPAVTA